MVNICIVSLLNAYQHWLFMPDFLYRIFLSILDIITSDLIMLILDFYLIWIILSDWTYLIGCLYRDIVYALDLIGTLFML